MFEELKSHMGNYIQEHLFNLWNGNNRDYLLNVLRFLIEVTQPYYRLFTQDTNLLTIREFCQTYLQSVQQGSFNSTLNETALLNAVTALQMHNRINIDQVKKLNHQFTKQSPFIQPSGSK